MCAIAVLICRRLLLSLTVVEVFLYSVAQAQPQPQDIALMSRDRLYRPYGDPCHVFSNPDTDKQEFLSPGYPHNYPKETECVLILTAEYGFAIKIDFRDYFQIEPSDNCEYDFLEVRDGAHGYSDLIGKYCGKDFPPIIHSRDQSLWLRFTSDDNIEYKGFRAVYEFIPNKAIDRPEPTNCFFQMEGIQGTISDRNVSNTTKDYSQTYNHIIDCTWHITVKPEEKIYLYFETFELHKPNECDLNFVDIFGQSTDLRDRKKHFCGSVADSTSTETNSMYFRFFARPETIASKFTAYFTAYRDRIPKTVKKGENPQCFETEYDCDDATCIDASLKCNGVRNCRHEYDEEGCNDALKKLKFDIRSEHIIVILILGCSLLIGMCTAMCYNCIRKLIKDGRQIHENIRRSREQLEDRSENTISEVSSPRIIYRPPLSEEAPCYISDNKRNGHPCIRNESESESEVDEDDEEEIDDDMEDSCVEMRDCECQTRDSLLTHRESGHTQIPMTPPPPPPPNRKPPGLPPLSPPPSVPTPPPPPGSHYGRAPSGPPSDHYGSYGRGPPVPRHRNDPYEVDDQSDDSYAQRYRAEAVIEMRDKGTYEPSKSPKTTPDVLATH